MGADDKGKSPSFLRQIDQPQTLQGRAVEKLKLLCHAAHCSLSPPLLLPPSSPSPGLIFLRKWWSRVGSTQPKKWPPDKSENMEIGHEMFTVEVVKKLNQHFWNLGVCRFLSEQNSKPTFTVMQKFKSQRICPRIWFLRCEELLSVFCTLIFWVFLLLYFCICVCN